MVKLPGPAVARSPLGCHCHWRHFHDERARRCRPADSSLLGCHSSNSTGQRQKSRRLTQVNAVPALGAMVGLLGRLTPATSAPGLRSPCPHLCWDWAHPRPLPLPLCLPAILTSPRAPQIPCHAGYIHSGTNRQCAAAGASRRTSPFGASSFRRSRQSRSDGRLRLPPAGLRTAAAGDAYLRHIVRADVASGVGPMWRRAWGRCCQIQLQGRCGQSGRNDALRDRVDLAQPQRHGRGRQQRFHRRRPERTAARERQVARRCAAAAA